MKCITVYEALKQISEGKAPSQNNIVEYLLWLGFLLKVSDTTGMNTELSALKKQLYDVKMKIRMLNGEITSDFSGKTIMELSHKEIQQLQKDLPAQETELRKKILEATQKAVPDAVVKTFTGQVALTYKGREAMQILETRFPGCENIEWETLVDTIEKLTQRLRSEAKESYEILKIISPKLRSIDEYLLRSAAVGLAFIDGAPEVKAKKFIDYVEAFTSKSIFDKKFATLGAETAVAHELHDKVSKEDIIADTTSFIQNIATQDEHSFQQRKAVAVLLMPKPRQDRQELIQKILQDAQVSGDMLVTALLWMYATDAHMYVTMKMRYAGWIQQLSKGQPIENNDDLAVAAVLLATAKETDEVLAEKFSKAESYMKQLFSESMLTASAMIAVWPSSVEESFDNIRLASSQILTNKLSVGGLENFSLGIKLFTHDIELSAGTPPPSPGFERVENKWTKAPVTPAVALAGGAGIVAGATLIGSPLLMRTPFTVFHSITLQKYVVNDFRYHPVHSNYLYG